jgi:hypothetical protein
MQIVNAAANGNHSAHGIIAKTFSETTLKEGIKKKN